MCFDDGDQCKAKFLDAYQSVIPPFVTQCLIDPEPCKQALNDFQESEKTFIIWSIALAIVNIIFFVALLTSSCIFKPN